MIRIREELLANDSLDVVLNIGLVHELTGYFYGRKSEWAEEHGFGYPGEALERFEERRALKTQADLRAFVLAAVMTVHYNYDYNTTQKEHFAQVVKSTEHYNQDGILQLLTSAWEIELEQREELDKTFVYSLQTQEEQIAALHLLYSFSVIKAYEDIALQIVSQLDLVTLNEKEVHEQVEPIKVLVAVYEMLRFKKTACKNFLPVYDFILYAWRLTKKELKTNILQGADSDLLSYQQAMNLTAKEILTLHHLLVHWNKTWGDIPAVAKERIFMEYVRVHLIAEEEVSEAFKQETNFFIKTQKIYKGSDIGRWIGRIKNEQNLVFIKELTHDFKDIVTTFSSLSMLDHPLFTQQNGKRLVTESLDTEMFNQLMRTKEGIEFSYFKGNALQQTWELVEKKRKEWEIERVTNSQYLIYLFDIGVYKKEDYQEIKAVYLEDSYRVFVKGLKNNQTEEYLRFLSIIPVEDREFLGDSVGRYFYSSGTRIKKYFDSEFSKKVTDKELYLSLLLETILYHDPVFYADELYRMIESGLFLEIGATEEETDELLRVCHAQELFFNESFAKQIKEKFMSEEEKIERDKQAMITTLQQCEDTYDVKGKFDAVIPYLIFEDVREALLHAFLTMKHRFSQDVPEIFHRLKVEQKNNRIPHDMLTQMFAKLDELIIEHEKVSRKELEYKLYVYKVLEKNKKEMEKKENEECLA